MGQAAANGDKLATPTWRKFFYGLGAPGTVAAGALATGHAEHAAAAVGIGGIMGGILNSLPLMEKFLQTPGVTGRAVAAFLRNPDPSQLPHNVVVAASKAITAIMAKPKANNKKRITW